MTNRKPDSSLKKLQNLWEDYWQARPASLSVAVIRIALGLSMIIAMRESCPPNISAFLAAQNPALYRPWGLLALFGTTVPSAAFFEFFQKVTLLSSITLILGFYSRTSLIVCCLSGLISVVLPECFQQNWSHGNNIVFLAFMGMAFVRCGDRLSVDAVLGEITNRGLSPEIIIKNGRRYFYGALLAQFAVSAMFLNAGFWKLRRGGRYLGWALSDNMRNLLISNRIVLGDDLPPHLHYIVMHEWAYKAIALGNLFSQVTPFMAMFLSRRPRLRALCGAVFLLEYFGLGIVMRIWVPQWIPLLVVFIDWDALVSWGKTRVALNQVPERSGPSYA